MARAGNRPQNPWSGGDFGTEVAFWRRQLTQGTPLTEIRAAVLLSPRDVQRLLDVGIDTHTLSTAMDFRERVWAALNKPIVDTRMLSVASSVWPTPPCSTPPATPGEAPPP